MWRNEHFIRVVAGFMLNFIPYAILCYIPFPFSFHLSTKKQYAFSIGVIGFGAVIFGFLESYYKDSTVSYMIILFFTCIYFIFYCLTVREPVCKLRDVHRSKSSARNFYNDVSMD